MKTLQLQLLLEGIDIQCPVNILWSEIGISTCQVKVDDRVEREQLLQELRKVLPYQYMVLI